MLPLGGEILNTALLIIIIFEGLLFNTIHLKKMDENIQCLKKKY
jgi:hypothetical protein